MCLLNYNKNNKKYKHLTYIERTIANYLNDFEIDVKNVKIWYTCNEMSSINLL